MVQFFGIFHFGMFCLYGTLLFGGQLGPKMASRCNNLFQPSQSPALIHLCVILCFWSYCQFFERRPHDVLIFFCLSLSQHLFSLSRLLVQFCLIPMQLAEILMGHDTFYDFLFLLGHDTFLSYFVGSRHISEKNCWVMTQISILQKCPPTLHRGNL